MERYLTENDEDNEYYRDNIRSFNMIFSFASLGGKVDRTVIKGRDPDMYQIQGENYHLKGNLNPTGSESAKSNSSKFYQNSCSC